MLTQISVHVFIDVPSAEKGELVDPVEKRDASKDEHTSARNHRRVEVSKPN